MLQFIRSKAGSVIVKILFAVLIFAFGAWGIGDIFRQRTASETTVANIGGIKVQADELQNAVRLEIERLRPYFNGNLDPEQAKQLGIVGNVLDRIVSRDLVDLEERRLGLLVDDQVVREAIVNNPAFHNSAGTFDRSIFNAVLANNRLTEDRFVANLRRDILQSALTSAVASGATAPSVLADALYRQRNEKRIGETVFVANDKAKVPEPSETDLQAYYDAHQADFRAPEYRGLLVASVKPEDLAASIQVPEDKLREEYQARLDEFQMPERRELEQIVVADEAKAKEVEAALAEGKDFAAVAKDVAGQSEDVIKLGWVQRGELPAAIADAAFALDKGETSKPIQDPLGWHILRATDVDTGGTKPFEEARAQVAGEVTRDMAADQLAKEANDIEDAVAGGTSLEDVATRFTLKTAPVASTDPDGHAPDGTIVTLPDPDILHVAFATEKGQLSRLAETKDGGYFIVRVDSVTPPAVRPLAEVKDRVKAGFLAEKQSAAAETEAKAIAAAIGDGKSLAEAAAAQQLVVETTAPVTRTEGGAAKLPATLVARLFELKPGETGVSAGRDGWFVVQLKSSALPDPAANKTDVDKVANQLGDGIRNDLLQQFDKALRSRFPVEINRAEIDRLL